jgi:hypothetical protein
MKHASFFSSRQAMVGLLVGFMGINGVAKVDAMGGAALKAALSAQFADDDSVDNTPKDPTLAELPLTVGDLEEAGDLHLAVFDFADNPRIVSIAALIELKSGLNASGNFQADSEAPVLAHVGVELQG